MATKHRNDDKALNWDPISGLPGAHPVGIGVGTAVGGAAIGTAGGAVAGPVGAAVGAVVGGIGGGLAGKAVAESIDPTAREAYWRETYPTRPYYEEDVHFETYAPAYRYGWESRARYHDREFDEVEPQLRSGWEKSADSRNLGWERAKHAVWDAWHDIECALPGDADRDGRSPSPLTLASKATFRPGGVPRCTSPPLRTRSGAPSLACSNEPGNSPIGGV